MTQTPARVLTAASFTLEPLEGQTFAGYTAGQQWNGWACPYFTKEQAQRIVEAWHTCGFKVDYDPADDVFRFAPFDPQADPTMDLGGETVDLGERSGGTVWGC